MSFQQRGTITTINRKIRYCNLKGENNDAGIFMIDLLKDFYDDIEVYYKKIDILKLQEEELYIIKDNLEESKSKLSFIIDNLEKLKEKLEGKITLDDLQLIFDYIIMDEKKAFESFKKNEKDGAYIENIDRQLNFKREKILNNIYIIIQYSDIYIDDFEKEMKRIIGIYNNTLDPLETRVYYELERGGSRRKQQNKKIKVRRLKKY